MAIADHFTHHFYKLLSGKWICVIAKTLTYVVMELTFYDYQKIAKLVNCHAIFLTSEINLQMYIYHWVGRYSDFHPCFQEKRNNS